MGMLGSSIMQLSGVTSLAGINLGGGDQQTEEGLAVLQSREFTEAFIHDENLMPVLFYRRWDEGKQQWKGARENWPTAAQAAKFFDKYVRKVNREKMTGLIHMTIDWTDPRLAADWANKLVARLNDEMRSRAISRSTVAVQYLEKELTTTTTVETRQAIGKIMAEQINSKMLANVTKEYAFRVVDRALPPDRNDRMSPRRLLLLALGLALGLLSGVFAVLVSGSIAKSANAN